jgi:uncharacterized membrane protein
MFGKVFKKGALLSKGGAASLLDNYKESGRDVVFIAVTGLLTVLTLLITALIMFLVGGLSRRALAAFLGASGGVIFTSVLAFTFTGWFKIHGAVRPFTEALLFSGYGHLNLAHLFIAGIFIAASGAMMDLAMDVAPVLCPRLCFWLIPPNIPP